MLDTIFISDLCVHRSVKRRHKITWSTAWGIPGMLACFAIPIFVKRHYKPLKSNRSKADIPQVNGEQYSDEIKSRAHEIWHKLNYVNLLMYQLLLKKISFSRQCQSYLFIGVYY